MEFGQLDIRELDNSTSESWTTRHQRVGRLDITERTGYLACSLNERSNAAEKTLVIRLRISINFMTVERDTRWEHAMDINLCISNDEHYFFSFAVFLWTQLQTKRKMVACPTTIWTCVQATELLNLRPSWNDMLHLRMDQLDYSELTSIGFVLDTFPSWNGINSGSCHLPCQLNS